GRALVTGRCEDIGKFKVPTLRALAARAPYFHNGSAATLEDVVEFYDRRFPLRVAAGGRAHPHPLLRPAPLPPAPPAPPPPPPRPAGSSESADRITPHGLLAPAIGVHDLAVVDGHRMFRLDGLEAHGADGIVFTAERPRGGTSHHIGVLVGLDQGERLGEFRT